MDPYPLLVYFPCLTGKCIYSIEPKSLARRKRSSVEVSKGKLNMWTVLRSLLIGFFSSDYYYSKIYFYLEASYPYFTNLCRCFNVFLIPWLNKVSTSLLIFKLDHGIASGLSKIIINNFNLLKDLLKLLILKNSWWNPVLAITLEQMINRLNCC